MARNKIILAYSGGLDTSVAIKWLQDKYDFDVIALAADVGEGNDLQAIQQKALDVGAIKCHVINANAQFAKEYVAPALKANALYENTYPLVSALSRPLIAKLLVDCAQQEGASHIAHGCTGKGNDQVRFEVSVSALDPTLKIVAPVRENPMSREAAIAYANKHQIPVPITKENPFSIDQNLWGRSCECGVLEDPWVEPPEAAYEWTQPISATPTDPLEITIEFAKGLPIAVNGKTAPLDELIVGLNEVGSRYGVGRIDHIENRLVGIKSREVYEAPAAMILIQAHRALEALNLPRELAHFKPGIEQKMAEVIYEGLWFSPLKQALDAFIDSSQQTINGKVRIKLHQGQSTVVGRQSTQSLYNLDLATYTPNDQFNHNAARGFIELWGLPSSIYASVNKQHTKEK